MKPTLPENRLGYMPRWKCRVGCFHDETYGFTVHLLVGVNSAKLTRYCTDMFSATVAQDVGEADDWCGRHMDVRVEDKKSSYEVHLVALYTFKWDAFWVSVLAHEMLHATHSVLGGRGLVMSDETIEAYTYMHDSLVKRSLKML